MKGWAIRFRYYGENQELDTPKEMNGTVVDSFTRVTQGVMPTLLQRVYIVALHDEYKSGHSDDMVEIVHIYPSNIIDFIKKLF